MINFSPFPLQSDLATLRVIAKDNETLLHALNKGDVEQLLQKSNLVPKLVQVHGKHGMYWSTRNVNPDPKPSNSKPATKQDNSDEPLTSDLNSFFRNLMKEVSSKPGNNSSSKPTKTETPSPKFSSGASSKPGNNSSSKPTKTETPSPKSKKMVTKPTSIDQKSILIDSQSTLSKEDQQAIYLSTPEQQAIYKTTGLFGANTGAIEYLKRYKDKVDANNQALYSKKFSQKSLDKTKENLGETLEYSLVGERLPLSLFKGDTSPDELLIAYRNDIINTLDESPQDPLYAVYSEAAQKWKEDVKSGKISKDDPDIFFVYARESILKRNLNLNQSSFQSVFGIYLNDFLPKDASQQHIFPDEKPIKGKLTALSPDSSEYKQIQDAYRVGYNAGIGQYDEKTNSFTSDLFSNVYTIKGIYKIEGLPGETEFQQFKKAHAKYSTQEYGGKNGHTDTFFHGTPLETSFRILGESGEFKQGDVGNGSAFGPGLYVTDNITTAFKYMPYQDPYDMSSGKAMKGEGNGTNYTGCVFLCEGSLGKCEFGTHIHNLTSEAISKLDSVGCPPINWPNKEWKFNNPNAAIPRYIIEVEVRPNKRRK